MQHKEARLTKSTQYVPDTPNDASLLEKDAAKVFTHAVFKSVRPLIHKSSEWEIIDTIEEESSIKYVLSLRENDDKI